MLIRTSSHRARAKLKLALAREVEYFYTLQAGGVFAEVTLEEWERVKIDPCRRRRIPGLTVARIPEGTFIGRCWK